jgi:hypothetical protein
MNQPKEYKKFITVTVVIVAFIHIIGFLIKPHLGLNPIFIVAYKSLRLIDVYIVFFLVSIYFDQRLLVPAMTVTFLFWLYFMFYYPGFYGELMLEVVGFISALTGFLSGYWCRKYLFKNEKNAS